MPYPIITTCVVWLTLLGISTSVGADAPTLCKSNERILFSCSTGSKTVSICASKDLSNTNGYMQYRYGRAGQIDLIYPDRGVRPVDAFTSGTMIYSGGGGSWLRFAKNLYQYTVFSAIGRWGPSGRTTAIAGVAVQKDHNEVANISCHSAVTNQLGPELFDHLGLKPTEPSQEFDIPNGFLPK